MDDRTHPEINRGKAMTMLLLESNLNPLELTSDGVVRVGGTRVTLDTLVETFQEGATPEEIVSRYPALQLADVYAAIAYYLRHSQEVEAYLAQQRQKSLEVRQMNEVKFSPQGIRDRLLARLQNRQF